MQQVMSPFDFAAKMWRGAEAMIYLQREVLGEQITLTGQELADIIAFVHDDAEQHKFTEADVPPRMRALIGHEHAAPGGGEAAHAEELGHEHGDEGQHHD